MVMGFCAMAITARVWTMSARNCTRSVRAFRAADRGCQCGRSAPPRGGSQLTLEGGFLVPVVSDH